jgi:hypothetical protein
MAKKSTKQIAEKTKQMTIRVNFKSSQNNTEKNKQALQMIEEGMEMDPSTPRGW